MPQVDRDQFMKDFFKACDQARALNVSDVTDKKYYTDFSSLRCAKSLDQIETLDQIAQIERAIVKLSPDSPTSHLFTGNIGCGKTTELLRLKNKLEEQNFEVIYYPTQDDLNLSDVTIADILLGIANQIIKYFSDNGIPGTAEDFGNLLNRFIDFLNSDISGIKVHIPKVGDFGFQSDKGKNTLSFVLGEIVIQSKNSTYLREVLRERIVNLSSDIMDCINQELIEPHQKYLAGKGKKTGLVVIVDGLERIQPACQDSVYLSAGTELKDLLCHMVYTVPFQLAFGTSAMKLQDKYGITNVLPLVRMYSCDRKSDDSCDRKLDSEGIRRMREMILRRAFPDDSLERSEELLLKIFDCTKTLDKLCFISGGHIRNLLKYIRRMLVSPKLPISEQDLNLVIQEVKNSLILNDDDWKALAEVREKNRISAKHYGLVDKLHVLAYIDKKGKLWFDVDPILAEYGEEIGKI